MIVKGVDGAEWELRDLVSSQIPLIGEALKRLKVSDLVRVVYAMKAAKPVAEETYEAACIREEAESKALADALFKALDGALGDGIAIGSLIAGLLWHPVNRAKFKGEGATSLTPFQDFTAYVEDNIEIVGFFKTLFDGVPKAASRIVGVARGVKDEVANA